MTFVRAYWNAILVNRQGEAAFLAVEMQTWEILHSTSEIKYANICTGFFFFYWSENSNKCEKKIAVLRFETPFERYAFRFSLIGTFRERTFKQVLC